MFKNSLFVVSVVLFLWLPSLFAQNVQIALQDAGISQYQSIFASDFDFLQVGSVEELFTMSVTKAPGLVSNAELTFVLEQEGELLATIRTNPFSMPFDAGQWMISNIELANENFRFDPADDPITISESGVEDRADALRDDILATSQLPTGTYTLKANLVYTDNSGAQETASGVNVLDIVITNPTLINLVSPGVSLNSGFDYELFTDLPLLQWNGNSGDFQVLVFKKRDEFASAEDILNSQPVWESERFSSLSAQYPDVGALPLEFGSTYVWLVRSYINSSSGEIALNSELWEFTVVDPSQSNTTIESLAKQELEILLKQLLGDRADSIIRQIEDYGLKTIRVNGSTISVQELYQFLEKYRDQEQEITDLILRSSN